MATDERRLLNRRSVQWQRIAGAAVHGVRAILRRRHDSTTVTVQDPQSAYTTTSLGLVGDAQTLLLHISRPLANLSYAAPQADVARRSDQRPVVGVVFRRPAGRGRIVGSGRGAQALAALTDPEATRTAARRPGGSCAARRGPDGDGPCRRKMDTAALAAAAQVIAPEIATLAFRYFDGQAWVETWDSTAMDRLPQAIEVTLGYRDAVGRGRRAGRLEQRGADRPDGATRDRGPAGRPGRSGRRTMRAHSQERTTTVRSAANVYDGRHRMRDRRLLQIANCKLQIAN